jgi:hypothetical protein
MSFPHAYLSPDVVPTLCVVDRVARVVDRVAGDSGLYPHMWAGGIQKPCRGRVFMVNLDAPGYTSGCRPIEAFGHDG